MTRLGELLREGVRSGIFPGAVAVVGLGGQVVFEEAVGHAQLVPAPRPMRAEALFDLASLTKVLCTVPVVLRLVAAGSLDLDAPVERWLPELRGAPCAGATLRQALSHTTGLPAWRPLYLVACGREAVVRVLAETGLEAPQGRRVVYSDLGMLLAGFVAERAGGAPLDTLFQQHVAEPLGLKETGFCPPPSVRGRCVATEEGNTYERQMAGPAGAGFPWREHVLVGEVHDGNAHYALGGVAPHAGLFSPAREVGRVVEAWLAAGSESRKGALAGGDRGPQKSRQRFLGWSRGWLAEGFVAEALEDQRRGAVGEPRGLGWVLHHPGCFFNAFGPRSFGHTGFTGTSVAADPDRGLWVVLLTNRVHPRVREGIDDFRRAFHEEVARLC